ncbi:hypothetical protein [Aurantiacibacter gilvus]|uniref:CPBP family intramembrane metalloprotease n=1 Tax=Aurantiacibacter gilvus TaxID=3139141 RepID=A0ABU9IAZ5_9SPHN
MSHYLGIVTAYAAAAVLVWLAALLHPESIPAAREYSPKHRVMQLGLFVLAMIGAAVLQLLENQGLLLPDSDPLDAALNQLLIFMPLVIYLIAQRSPAAAMMPVNGLLRSLAGGVALALIALAAYLSGRGAWEDLPDLAARMLSVDRADRFAQLFFLDLALGTLLALLSGGWSRKLALIVLGAIVLLVHIGVARLAGIGFEAIGGVLLGSAVAFGLLSAVIYTRNIVWFWPVHAMLGVLLLLVD